MSLYLDFSATTPVDPDVSQLVMRLMVEEYGNAGSRTHTWGVEAKRRVEAARDQVASIVEADKTEVTFTSGATESNNIAILGLEAYANQTGKKHIVSSSVEHKAVLEPCMELEKKGFDVTFLSVNEDGCVDVEELKRSLRQDTLLVSIMHINNETGSIQPIKEICALLSEHDAFFHVDAAQGFGKYIEDLRDKRIDMISASGHKLFAPKGVGALIARRRGFYKVPLSPLMFGGGQERGLRPGTLAVPLIAGFGLACQKAYDEMSARLDRARQTKSEVNEFLASLGAQINGSNASDYIVNFSIPGLNSEAAMVVFKDVIAVSNGSACTSNSYTPSHVLTAMGLDEGRASGAIRMSWGHESMCIPFDDIKERIASLI